MKIVTIVFGIGMLACGYAEAKDVQLLLQEFNCRICHSDYETRTGPAYVDVAARYRGNRNAVSILVAVIRKGVHGEGPWPMPPLPEVSPANAKQIAEYILSLKPYPEKPVGKK